MPWKVSVSIGFEDKSKAYELERYLDPVPDGHLQKGIFEQSATILFEIAHTAVHSARAVAE